MVVAVLDVGKTAVKLSAVESDGRVLETMSTSNSIIDGRFYPIADYARIDEFLQDGLDTLRRRHRLTEFIAATFGSAGVLLNRDGSTTPLPDYEASVPANIEEGYAAIADSYFERGGSISRGASHLAKQLFWLQTSFPAAFGEANALLPGPQYWAWRLSGVKAMDVTSLGAQSHLWDARAFRFSPIVARQGWTSLLPPLRASEDVLGIVLPSIADKLSLEPEMRIHCGVHDSSANFYRYEAQGMRDITLLSMGTWIVGLTDSLRFADINGSYDISLQVSAAGKQMAGVRSMAGREFELLSRGFHGQAPREAVSALMRRGTFPLPSFVDRDGIVPNSGGRGRIVGAPPSSAAEHAALALLYVVLLADLSIDRLQGRGTIILDGSATSHGLFNALLAALRPGRDVLVAEAAYGTAAGAAMLTRPPGAMQPPTSLVIAASEQELPILSYRTQWRKMVNQIETREETICPQISATI